MQTAAKFEFQLQGLTRMTWIPSTVPSLPLVMPEINMENTTQFWNASINLTLSLVVIFTNWSLIFLKQMRLQDFSLANAHIISRNYSKCKRQELLLHSVNHLCFCCMSQTFSKGLLPPMIHLAKGQVHPPCTRFDHKKSPVTDGCMKWNPTPWNCCLVSWNLMNVLILWYLLVLQLVLIKNLE